MTIEDELKSLILNRYKSIREFTTRVDIPYSTMDSILKRGVNNSNIQNIIKICKELNISAYELAHGKISYDRETTHSLTDLEDIVNVFDMRLRGIKTLSLSGQPVNYNDIDFLIQNLKAGLKFLKYNKTHNKNITE